MATNVKTYNFFTGTFKQGDDCSNCLDVASNVPSEALMELSRLYKDASDRCVVLAKALEKDPSASLVADTHAIYVTGNPEVFSNLADPSGGVLLEEDDYLEEDDDDYGYDDDGYYSDDDGFVDDSEDLDLQDDNL